MAEDPNEDTGEYFLILFRFTSHGRGTDEDKAEPEVDPEWQ